MAGETRPLGDMLDRFAAFHHMGDDALAGFLGVAQDRLRTVRAESLPEERAPEFGREVERVAGASGVSAARLMQVARIAKLLR